MTAAAVLSASRLAYPVTFLLRSFYSAQQQVYSGGISEALPELAVETGLAGWGGRIRTSASGTYVQLASLLSCLAERGQIVHARAGSLAHDLLHSSCRTIAVGSIGHDWECGDSNPAAPASQSRLCACPVCKNSRDIPDAHASPRAPGPAPRPRSARLPAIPPQPASPVHRSRGLYLTAASYAARATRKLFETAINSEVNVSSGMVRASFGSSAGVRGLDSGEGRQEPARAG
jgi:hypothetical protein